ncbi:flagellar basal body-associated FliL family protein [Skermanella pratensis]|uniref:flagellar basal body-associated FliL family protein n=1 Tax=Skermanella pratensis TaxID=2233999 RepID=UPI0013010F26|nr:flagellar basal body-associated FliL family protein [Skermanella pratensis]
MKILILLLVALLFGGGGFGAGWFLFANKEAHEEKVEAAPEPPPPTGPPVFVNIGPLTVPVLGAERIDQFVTLMVALEVADAPMADRVREQAPRLTDAFLTGVYGAIASGKAMQAGMLDVPQVKAKLNEATTKVMGKGVVRDVLIQVVNQRPM